MNAVATNRETFERLGLEMRPKALALALRLSRNRTDAEDLVQTAYTKAWRAFDSFDSTRPFQSWILRIVQRTYLDTVRANNRRPSERAVESMVDEDGSPAPWADLPDQGLGPEGILVDAERTLAVRSAIDRLPDIYAEVIRRCDLEDESYSEAADALHTTVGTIRSRLHRGRKLLRKELSRIVDQLV